MRHGGSVLVTCGLVYEPVGVRTTPGPPLFFRSSFFSGCRAILIMPLDRRERRRGEGGLFRVRVDGNSNWMIVCLGSTGSAEQTRWKFDGLDFFARPFWALGLKIEDRFRDILIDRRGLILMGKYTFFGWIEELFSRKWLRVFTKANQRIFEQPRSRWELYFWVRR